MYLLAIDPGKHIGWALFVAGNGREVGRGVIDLEELDEHFAISRFDFDELPELSFDGRFLGEIVIENYIGRPGAKNGGQLLWGPECIGRIETYAKLTKTPFRRQRAVDVLQVTALHAGYKMPKGHLPDQDSAYLHGYYRLEQLGILRAKPLD